MKHVGDKVRGFFLIALTYLLWGAAAVIALGIMFVMRSFILIELPIVLGVDHWTVGAIDKMGIIILGIMWLVFVLGSEPYFRRLYTEQMPIINVLKIFIGEGLLLAAIYGGRQLLLG